MIEEKLNNRPKIKRIKDPVSGLTHLAGAIASIIGLIILIKYAQRYGTLRHIIGFSVFGVSLILLYSASATYHLVNASARIDTVLRKVDHMMIYVLIAGTYTPICLIALKGAWGLSLLISIWVLALAGCILTVVWLGAPRWLTTAIYILMGWLVIIALVPLVHTISWAGMGWLLGGGIAYTVGGVIYGTKWPPIASRWFGFHEIFHIFVLAGSMAHYWLMFRYIMYV